jgi:predicted dehydrogenase
MPDPAPPLNVCLIGQKFMGRAHSNAWLKAPRFFTDLPVRPAMHTVVARNGPELAAFAERWGWQHHTTDWRAAVADPDVGLVDVTTPNNLHREFVVAALAAGKHVACEKPLAATLADARAMRDAAANAAGKTFVWYSYRRVPAVALAHQLVKAGRIGRVYHVRAYYLQDWAGPEVPLVWRFDAGQAGSGSHGDLGAHIIDMARFVTGEEITEVIGAAQDTFVKQRKLLAAEDTGGISGATDDAGRITATAGATGPVTVDDHTTFLARLSGGGIATFEATRFATGYHNKNGLEVHGERGALRFNFEEMVYLDYFDRTADPQIAGWTRIPASRGGTHPYAAAWWPTAHHQGYEHTFVNMAADICRVVGGGAAEVELPDFADAYATQEVLEAATMSAQQRRPVPVAELR